MYDGFLKAKELGSKKMTLFGRGDGEVLAFFIEENEEVAIRPIDAEESDRESESVPRKYDQLKKVLLGLREMVDDVGAIVENLHHGREKVREDDEAVDGETWIFLKEGQRSSLKFVEFGLACLEIEAAGQVLLQFLGGEGAVIGVGARALDGQGREARL